MRIGERKSETRWVLLTIILGLTEFQPALAQDDVVELPALTVTASRVGIPTDHTPFPTKIFGGASLLDSVDLVADDLLRTVAGFSLFRRTPATAAHPTAQGATLRGIGPSGASRSLVLLDGVPFNDPFGGWVTWSQLGLQGMERVEVVRGGGSAAWGNTALGGVIQFLPRRPEAETLELRGQAGEYGTWQAGFYASERSGSLGVALEGAAYSTDGYNRVRSDQRGTVDQPRWTRYRFLNPVVEYELSENARLTVRGGYFEEERGNGTPLTGNTTETGRLHGKLEWRAGDGADWRSDLYWQRGDYSSTFSSVDEGRNTENLVLDQHSVPSRAVGGSLRRTSALGASANLTVGTDLRRVSGETNEYVVFQQGDRVAGGEQNIYGLFLDADGEAGSVHWQAGLRGDYWDSRDGFIQQPNEPREAYSDRNKWLLNARAGVTWEARDNSSLRAAVYQAFRVPTINEQYRPFRVGSDTTLANAGLDPERLLGGELGVDLRPGAGWRLSATAFLNTVEDPVLNVTIGGSPESGVLRQRRNIGRTEIRGLEVDAEVALGREISFQVSWALTDALVESAPDQPVLQGKRLAQVARHVATAGLRYEPAETGIRAGLRARWNGDQYEDDLNSRRLGGYLVVDLSLGYRIADRREVFFVVENLFDRTWVDGIGGDNLVSIGAPQTFRAGLRWAF